MKMAAETKVGEAEWEVKIPEKKLKDRLYFENLKAMVIDTQLCSRCLTCVSICPGGLLVNEEDIVDFPDFEDKCLDCGACVRVCPRYDYKPKSGLGDYIEFTAGQSKRFKGQDGAMGTEFIFSAMDMGLIDRGIFVDRDEQWRTSVFHVRGKEQLEKLPLGGTKYTFADIMPELKKAVMFTKKGVGVVGTPCMVSGVRKLQEEFPVFKEKVKLVVGLFCTENYHYAEVSKYLIGKGVDYSKLIKTDIIKGKFVATMTDKEVKFKVAKLDDILPSGCNRCTDFTAVESDVSVGSVGSAVGFSTIVVRTEAGKEVWDYIKKMGNAEVGEGKVEELDFLINHKKEREKNIQL
ncbi:MAG: Coenzyme F420 hydrogenase/dehydrogenase, beta subunit C-terminal domain [Euryarchaeota archaeon]|nr:Coenzyme F420 hydrogenase/dehydrogenase, beta subunit C-terminal domain [Euryarchaeota archaeon]